MRIVVIHNYYRQPGGEDESFRSEVQVLTEAGHEVVPFVDHNDRVASLGRIRAAMRTVWSSEAYHRVRAVLRSTNADILHVQNFFPLFSPSVYYAARAEGVPVVQSLRNYRLLCPNAIFFREGRVCEGCMGKTLPWPGIVHSCYRGDRSATAAVAMTTTHRLLGTWLEAVDLYVALTEFARQKFIQGGIPAEKIVVKPNFVHPDPQEGGHTGDYMLFVGRLSQEKGLATLLQAWEQTGRQGKLRIVGQGPLQSMVQDAAARLPDVEYLGHRPVHEVYTLMGEARAVILPSEWYETFGRVAVEAFAKGTPVIAARIGAVAELVEEGRTGLLFTPGDVTDLCAKVKWAMDHPQQMYDMGQAARQEYTSKYTAKRNHEQLMAIYTQAMDGASISLKAS